MIRYALKPSRVLFTLTVSLYALVILGILLCFDFHVVTGLVLGLVCWMLFAEIKQFAATTGTAVETLILNASAEIQWVASDGVHQFGACDRLYTSRWALVLAFHRLCSRRNLILLADRFQSPEDYLDCRYRLIRSRHAD